MSDVAKKITCFEYTWDDMEIFKTKEKGFAVSRQLS